MNPLLFILLLCTDCTLVVVNFLYDAVVFYAERFNCSVIDLIHGRLPIIINSYVRNSVDQTTLDRVAFLRKLIMIRDSSLTLSGLLSSDELNTWVMLASASILMLIDRKLRLS